MLPQGIPFTSLAELKAIPSRKLFGFETSKVILESKRVTLCRFTLKKLTREIFKTSINFIERIVIVHMHVYVDLHALLFQYSVLSYVFIYSSCVVKGQVLQVSLFIVMSSV